MFLGTLAIASTIVPFLYVYSRFKDKQECTTFDVIEEEVQEETEQEPGQRAAIELEELLMDSGKNVNY